MTDDEMQTAISIAKEHWLEISGKTKVWLIPDPSEESRQARRMAQVGQQKILQHGAYRFIYLADHDELYISHLDEEF